MAKPKKGGKKKKRLERERKREEARLAEEKKQQDALIEEKRQAYIKQLKQKRRNEFLKSESARLELEEPAEFQKYVQMKETIREAERKVEEQRGWQKYIDCEDQFDVDDIREVNMALTLLSQSHFRFICLLINLLNCLSVFICNDI